MLRLLQDLVRDLVNPNVGTDPDESLWSPSGWSEGVAAREPELLNAPKAVNTNSTAADRLAA